MSIKPTDKAPELEAALTSIFGFDRRANIEARRCCPPPIGCGGLVLAFKDEPSRREYAISGLCQACQDRVFDVRDEGDVPPKQRSLGPNDYATERGEMICGQSDAQERLYQVYKGKSGRTWLVADQVAAAENIYVTNNAANTTSPQQGFEGFGGSTLTFKLVNGDTFEAHGPWHSGADALYADTGIDVRDSRSSGGSSLGPTDTWYAQEKARKEGK